MSVSSRSLALAVAALVLPAVVFAQDGGSNDKPPAPRPAAPDDPPPAQPAPPPADPAELLQRMSDLYGRILVSPPARVAKTAGSAKPVSPQKAQEDWDDEVRDLAKTGDDYAAALAGTAPDPLGLFYRGMGHTLRARRDSANAARAHYETAAEALQAYLDRAEEKSEHRAEAEHRLGEALVHLQRLDDAAVHLGRAIDLYQRADRHDDAGECAYLVMAEMKAVHRESDLRRFATSVHADDGDFGASTASIRKLAAAARLSVGAPLPELPAVTDADGRPISWKPGKPLLVHFFLTGFLNAMPSSFREIETDVLPLWTRYREKGLLVVGVSMDYEIPEAQAKALRAKWDEWGRKMEFRDGSLESVRAWTRKQGVEWPWYWDGKAVNNPVSAALGGVGVTHPYAVLVDKDGIVRWLGDAPFEGLGEAVAKLLP